MFEQYHEPPDELSAETRTFARIIASLTEAVNELHAKATFVVAEPPAESEPKEGENEPPKLNLHTPC